MADKENDIEGGAHRTKVAARKVAKAASDAAASAAAAETRAAAQRMFSRIKTARRRADRAV